MNLYLKYGPLAYKWNTRITHKGDKKLGIKAILFNLFGYLFYGVCIWMVPFLYFYFDKQISLLEFIKSIGFYFLLYFIFSIFYEIGYLHNDYVAKKEINPTLHIYEKVDNKFYIVQVFLRIILGFLGLFLIYCINPEIAKIFAIMILVTLIIYFLHNLIRNYFYNFMTLLGLRIMKFSIVFLVLYFVLGTFDSVYYLYLTLLFFMFQYYDHIILFNKRMGGINKLENGIGKYFYLFICCLIFFFLTKDPIFIYYGVLFLVLFFLLTKKEDFINSYKR